MILENGLAARVASLESVLLDIVTACENGKPMRASILAAQLLLDKSENSTFQNELFDSLDSIRKVSGSIKVKINNLSESVLSNHLKSGNQITSLYEDLSLDQRFTKSRIEVGFQCSEVSDVFTCHQDESLIVFVSHCGVMKPVALSNAGELYVSESNEYIASILAGEVGYVSSGDFY